MDVNPPERRDCGAQRCNSLRCASLVVLLCATCGGLGAQSNQADPVMARWRFSIVNHAVTEELSGNRDELTGGVYPSASPVGSAVELDGYTGAISGPPLAVLENPEKLGISAWIDLDAYPWNLAPILDQRTPKGSFFFGVDATGHLIVRDGNATSATVSLEAVPLRQWTLVTLGLRHGHILFTINGSATGADAMPAEEQKETASEWADDGNNLLIGHTRVGLLPGPAHRIHPDFPVEYSIEGDLGELTLYREPLSDTAAKRLLAAADPSRLRPRPWPELPRWQDGPGSFGAFYTTLHFDPLWDTTRRTAPDSDVVVRFDDSPAQLVFWQGTNYVPAWVTENDNWYTDEFMEIYGHPRCPYGEDCEPMSDKQSRYSHVRILESTPARVVVHWRYALSEVERYAIGDAASTTAWGDWADEYWTVYPDHVAVRRSVLWSTAPAHDKTEFQESIVIVPPGKTPEDCLHLNALTFANLNGESRSYSWKLKTASGLQMPKGPASFPEPKNAVIQEVNLKSKWKPFEVLWGEPVSSDAYNGEASISSFEWWNHWPVAQIPSSGRPVLAADRAGHTSLSHLYWPIYKQDDATVTKLLMTGLTLLPADRLATLAKSWRTPAELRLQDGRAVPYDPEQRAYILPANLASPLRFSLSGSAEHPIWDPAFVLQGWPGNARVAIVRGGEGAGPIRQGVVTRLSGSRLIVFVPLTAEHKVAFEIMKR